MQDAYASDCHTFAQHTDTPLTLRIPPKAKIFHVHVCSLWINLTFEKRMCVHVQCIYVLVQAIVAKPALWPKQWLSENIQLC